MEETPIFDELEAKWSQVAIDRRICDEYWRVSNVQTGAEWYEDDEGNEVLHAYLVPQEVQPGDSVSYLGEVEQPKRKYKLFGRNQDCNGCL